MIHTTQNEYEEQRQDLLDFAEAMGYKRDSFDYVGLSNKQIIEILSYCGVE